MSVVSMLGLVGINPAELGEKVSVGIVAGVNGLLDEVARDPQHPRRAAFNELLAGYIERLKHDEAFRLRIEQVKRDFLAKCPGVGQVNPQGYVCVYVRYANYGGGTPYFQLLNPMTGGYGASTSRMLFVMTTGGGTRSFAVGSWALRTGDASTATRTSGSGKAGVLK